MFKESKICSDYADLIVNFLVPFTISLNTKCLLLTYLPFSTTLSLAKILIFTNIDFETMFLEFFE